MHDETVPVSHADGHMFRFAVGLIAVVGSFAAFIGLFFIEIPARNENALMFAMGIVFGWGSAVFASEYGSSNVGRKVAEGAIKRMERIPAVIPVVAGTEGEVLDVNVVNAPTDPVPTLDTKGKKP